ncbi:MAG: hypothetical protein KHY99_10015 [Acinetobacter sp.]|uniref:hypothetical protein n=1 Tax=Acinetobacter sp. TaxID=472 RepID=UPI00257EFBEA|nr:hypothetical protein [Acinetobacter sp.]MBS5200542.1 hypothetical protein [Acinetobacter sp.]
MEFLDFGDMPKMTPIIGKLPKLGTNKAEILMFLWLCCTNRLMVELSNLLIFLQQPPF